VTPEQLREALEVALRDFQHPTSVDLRLEVGEQDGDGLVWVWQPDGSGAGLWLEPDAGEAAVLVRAADFLQEQVFDQLDQTWGEARPPCPGHQHAPDPCDLDGEAWWVCPRTGERVGRVGALGRDRR
jgi:hypothetical protein